MEGGGGGGFPCSLVPFKAWCGSHGPADFPTFQLAALCDSLSISSCTARFRGVPSVAARCGHVM